MQCSVLRKPKVLHVNLMHAETSLGSLSRSPATGVPPWGLVYDIKKDVPPWGLIYDIKKDVFPPHPAYTLWCFGEEMSVHLTHVCG